MASEDDITKQAAKRRITALERRKEAEAGKGPWPPPDERTPEQRAEVEAYELATKWLHETWGTQPAPHCPYCQNNVWSVGVPTRLATVPIYASGSQGALPPVFPVMWCGISAKQLEREIGVTYKAAHIANTSASVATTFA